MKFTTPCFVRVEDAEKRKELIDFCKNWGYTAIYSIDPTYEFVVCGLVSNNVDVASSYDSDTMRKGLVYYGLIDCGDNIELFKALAAMNDENDYMQYFIDTRDGSMNLSEHKSIGLSALVYRKATAQEIIEWFNRKRK